MRYVSITDQGLVRKNNEDSLAVQPCGDHLLFAVADGMGGHAMGEVASKTALNYILSTLPQEIIRTENQRDLVDLLHQTVVKANIKVFLESLKDPGYYGMGTTLTLGVLRDWRLYLSHIGDSRAYLLHGSRMDRLTLDHTLVQQMVEEGMLSETDAQVHPKRHVLTRSLGVNEYVIPDTTSFDISEGDILLLCTDGLHGYVSEKEIKEILRKHKDLELCGQQLIQAANRSGGHDNVSVVLVHCDRKKNKETV